MKDNKPIIRTELSYSFQDPDGSGVRPCIFDDSNHSIRVSGLFQIIQELKRVGEALEIMPTLDRNNAQQGIILRHLWESSIIGYGRCFVEAEGRKVKLDLADLKGLPSNHKALHEGIMDLRHQLVAHAGKSGKKANSVAILLNPPHKERKVVDVGNVGLHITVPDFPFVKEFHDHCGLLISIISEKQEKAREKLLKIYQGKNIDELYSMASQALSSTIK
jgi:hypothetical protein